MTEGRYTYYGLRAHRADAVVGERLPNSLVWVDGECTDEEQPGVATLRITAPSQAGALIDQLRTAYCWSDETLVLVGGDVAEVGYDDGELVIQHGVCLAVL